MLIQCWSAAALKDLFTQNTEKNKFFFLIFFMLCLEDNISRFPDNLNEENELEAT